MPLPYDSDKTPAGESGTGEDLDELSKQELMERARELNVEGRSSMTKEELVEAIDAAEQEGEGPVADPGVT